MSREELHRFLKLTLIQGAQVIDALAGGAQKLIDHKDEIVERFQQTIDVPIYFDFSFVVLSNFVF